MNSNLELREEDLNQDKNLQASPGIQEENTELSGDNNCQNHKDDPPDEFQKEKNIQSQIGVNLAENESEYVMGTNLEFLNTNIKEEPINIDIDYNMCITKVTTVTSDTQSANITDINAITSGCHIENQNDKATNEHSNAYSAKAAMDEYLDGFATPVIIPRLNIKTEFPIPKSPQAEASTGCTGLDTDDLFPPPPSFPSNSNSDVADGIATPRIIASTTRLRVKKEFSYPAATPQHTAHESCSLSEDGELGEASPDSYDATDDEPIPDDFFDDLLHDEIKERIQVAQDNELEEKYSDRLKELKKLNKLREKESRKNRKKQKKSKKKSRKRSRSRSLSPITRSRDRSNLCNLNNHDKNKRTRNDISHREVMEQNFVCSDTSFKIKTESEENARKESALLIENFKEIEEELTPAQKREKAIRRATALRDYLKFKSDDNSTDFSTFSFASTVRKLPTSYSYVQQQMYENRSPLHTVNNVSYKCNSNTKRFNMDEWGLAALPRKAAEMAKLVGCDAQFISNKLKTIKIPSKLRKIKQESNIEVDNVEEEDLIESTSSLYSNAMVQTDDISEFNMTRKKKGYEIGVQVKPNVYSIGCQTLQTQSPIDDVHKDDDVPIMKIIRDLNENQLMAIHAFGELIKAPNSNANAMDMYKIQMKILDIYKMSQIPSALVTPETPSANNYTTDSNKSKNQPNICEQSVQYADDKQFSPNDPRAKSATYAKRVVTDYGPSPSTPSYSRSSRNESSRYCTSGSRPPTFHYRQNSTYNDHTSPTRFKHYGRGGLRRS